MKASSLEFSSNIKKKLHICVKQKKKQQQENPAVKETIAEGILIWKKIERTVVAANWFILQTHHKIDVK